MHCAQFVQSHALSFFYLSSPDLLLGMDSDPAKRNILGVIEKYPELARDGIELRKFGQQVIEGLAGERIHPSWIVPGGVNAPLASQTRDRILAGLPAADPLRNAHFDLLQIGTRRLQRRNRVLRLSSDHVCGTGGRKRRTAVLRRTHPVPRLRWRLGRGSDSRPADYARYIGEATERDSLSESRLITSFKAIPQASIVSDRSRD